MRILAAASLYFAIVFACGFVLGPVRMFWLEPLLGATLAVACETPLLIVAMFFGARFAIRKVRLDRGFVTMGLVALAMTEVAETGLGYLLRGLSLTAQMQRFAAAPGMIYAAALLVFAAMPALLNRRAA